MFTQLEEWTLTKVFNRIQVLSTNKEYIYNKQECINSKPVLQAGNENLIEYNCFLQLHAQFCNPAKIIDMIEQRAKSREPVDWLFHGEYMGQFVINSIEKTIQNQIKGTILYAEVTFNLLENPNEEEFLQQKTGDVDLSEMEQYSENSNKLKDFAIKVKDSVMNNMKEAVAASVLSENLSEAAKEIFSDVTGDVLNDLTGANITEIYNKASYYANIIQGNNNLNLSDLTELTEAIMSIPDVIMNSAFRNGD